MTEDDDYGLCAVELRIVTRERQSVLVQIEREDGALVSMWCEIGLLASLIDEMHVPVVLLATLGEDTTEIRRAITLGSAPRGAALH